MSDKQKSDEGAGEKARGQPYWWFQGASVLELYDRLAFIGPDTARLEVRQRGDGLYLSVVNGNGAAEQTNDDPPINESRLCPPICP